MDHEPPLDDSSGRTNGADERADEEGATMSSASSSPTRELARLGSSTTDVSEEDALRSTDQQDTTMSFTEPDLIEVDENDQQIDEEVTSDNPESNRDPQPSHSRHSAENASDRSSRSPSPLAADSLADEEDELMDVDPSSHAHDSLDADPPASPPAQETRSDGNISSRRSSRNSSGRHQYENEDAHQPEASTSTSGHIAPAGGSVSSSSHGPAEPTSTSQPSQSAAAMYANAAAQIAVPSTSLPAGPVTIAEKTELVARKQKEIEQVMSTHDGLVRPQSDRFRLV